MVKFFRLLERLKNGFFRGLENKTSSMPGFLGALARWGWARRNGARLILVTSLAAGLTWFVSYRVGIDAPIIAAVAATLTVQAAVVASAREGFNRVVATIAGLGLAVLVFHLLGIHAWSLALVVAVSLIVGRLMGLGPEGSLQVPATSLGVFVLGNSLSSDVLFDRVSATVLGVFVGVTLSAFAHRSSPMERALGELGSLSSEVGSLLSQLAQGVREGLDKSHAAELLEQSRDLNDRFLKTESLVASAIAAAKWGGRKAREEALHLDVQSKALEHSCEQVNSIARTLFDLNSRTSPVPSSLASVLEKTSKAFALNAASLDPAVETPQEQLEEVVEDIRSLKDDAVRSARSTDETSVWLISGSILSDVERMAESLDQSAPALQVGKEEIKPPLRVPISKHFRKEV